jgi:hypothetical protein
MRFFNFFILFLVSLLLISCGPMNRTYVRTTFDEVQKDQSRIAKNDVTIEAKALMGHEKNTVPSFFVTYTYINEYGKEKNARDNIFLDKELLVFEVKVENNTKHVLRFLGTVIKLIDPTANVHDALTQMDIISLWQGFAGSDEVAQQVKNIPFINSNIEVLPGYAFKGYLVFRKDINETPGVYKLGIFDLTTKVDNVGAPVAKDTYDFRYIVRKYREVYEVDIWKGTKKLLSSDEIK